VIVEKGNLVNNRANVIQVLRFGKEVVVVKDDRTSETFSYETETLAESMAYELNVGYNLIDIEYEAD